MTRSVKLLAAVLLTALMFLSINDPAGADVPSVPTAGAAGATQAAATTGPADQGVLPVGEDGKPLNLDFETGDLRDWTQTSGNAFTGQPVKGDAIRARRKDQQSRHQANFWIGTYEVREDGPR